MVFFYLFWLHPKIIILLFNYYFIVFMVHNYMTLSSKILVCKVVCNLQSKINKYYSEAYQNEKLFMQHFIPLVWLRFRDVFNVIYGFECFFYFVNNLMVARVCCCTFELSDWLLFNPVCWIFCDFSLYMCCVSVEVCVACLYLMLTRTIFWIWGEYNCLSWVNKLVSEFGSKASAVHQFPVICLFCSTVLCVCVRVCVRACVRACVSEWVREREREGG